MSKNYAILLVVIAVVLGGFWFSRQNNQSMMPAEDTVMEKPEGNSTMPVSGRRYVAFDPAVFTTSSNTRRVLFFYANWCPTCIPAHADFEKNASLIPSDVTVIRVNYNDADTDDSEKALAKQYGITYQHTFVQLGNQGEVITKWNGGATKELLAKIK